MKKTSNMKNNQGNAGMGNLESMQEVTNMQSNTMIPSLESIQGATIQNHEGIPYMQSNTAMQSKQKMSSIQNNKSSK